MGYIYMLKNNINGKIYIGQTTRSIKKRFKEHKDKKSGCVAIYNAIQYHGWDNFEKDWYECPDDDLNFDEELLVREMGTLAPEGYNLREGGGATGKLSEETKQKISEAQLGDKGHMYGKTHTKEARQKMSESSRGDNHPMYGKFHTDETKQKIGQAHLGKTLSKEHKQKVSEVHRGKTLSKETKQKMSEAKKGKTYNSRKVYQYNMEGMLLRTFEASEEAGRYVGKDSSAIRRCARGKRNSAYGFKWSYKIT
jgi:group I intron endonuclease